MGIQLPPALAGDNAEVSADAEGLKNWGMFVAGLTATGLAAVAAGRLKDGALSAAHQDTDDSGGLSFRGEI